MSTGSARAIAAAALLGSVAVAAACANADRTVLDVRTTLPSNLRDAVEARFERDHPEVDVRFSEASVDATLEGLLQAGGSPPFDVWWGAPALALREAEREGRVSWRPLLTTAFVLAFDRTKVPLAEAPTDWIDIFHHAWYDDLRALDPGRSDEGAFFLGSMLVEFLRDGADLEYGLDWFARLDEQVDSYGASTDEIVRALGRGDALVAVVPRAEAERLRADDAPWLHYRVPTSGVPALVLGVGVAEGSDREEIARAFADWVRSDEVATLTKLHTHWDPVDAQVSKADLPPDFELEQSWRAYPPALDTLAAELEGWVERWETQARSR